MSGISCTALEKAFGGVAALGGVDLEVVGGSLTAVLGPSGCGKTTLLRLIAGFDRPDRGMVAVGGRTVTGPGVWVPPERRRVGIVPQEQALFPHMSVAANVGYGLGRGGDRTARVEAMLALCGLTGLGARMPHELSGGQQQRVAVARALAPQPSVVLLDEPFGSLDTTLRAGLRADVADILRTSGQTAVLVTHDQEEALSMADGVAVMRDGRIVQHGSPVTVYNHPADLWVAGFVGSANILDGRVLEPGRVLCALGPVTTAPTGAAREGAVRVVVRPEQMVLASGDGVPGVVEHREYYGHDGVVRVVLGDGTRIVARADSDSLPATGSPVAVSCRGPVVCFPPGH